MGRVMLRKTTGFKDIDLYLLPILRAGIASKPKGVTWNASDLEQATFDLLRNMRFDAGVPYYLKELAVLDALAKCVECQRLNSKSFLQFVNTYICDHDNRKKVKYIVVTQVNATRGARRHDAPRDVRMIVPSIEGRFEITTRIPKKVVQALSKADDRTLEILALKRDFLYAVGEVYAKDDMEALAAGYDIMSVGFGILNLGLHRVFVNARHRSPRTPFGHLLHASSLFMVKEGREEICGFIGTSQFPNEWKFELTVDLQSIINGLAFSKKFVSSVKRIDGGDQIKNATRLLQEGLSANAVDVALLRFWTAFEVLCGTGDGTKKQTPKS